MSKLLKILGIGTAIGTVVYGVIKYKTDEKFKEKVDEVGDKIEEKADAAMTKASKFMNEHPGTTTLCIACIGLTVGTIGAIRADRKRSEMMERAYQDFHEQYFDEEDPSEEVNREARAAAERQMLIDEIMSNPRDYLVVPKESWEYYQHTAAIVEELERHSKENNEKAS